MPENANCSPYINSVTSNAKFFAYSVDTINLHRTEQVLCKIKIANVETTSPLSLLTLNEALVSIAKWEKWAQWQRLYDISFCKSSTIQVIAMLKTGARHSAKSRILNGLHSSLSLFPTMMASHYFRSSSMAIIMTKIKHSNNYFVWHPKWNVASKWKLHFKSI